MEARGKLWDDLGSACVEKPVPTIRRGRKAMCRQVGEAFAPGGPDTHKERDELGLPVLDEPKLVTPPGGACPGKLCERIKSPRLTTSPIERAERAAPGLLPPSHTSGLGPRPPPAGNHILAAIPRGPPHEAIRRVALRVCDLKRRDEEPQVEDLAEREENTDIVVREAVGLIEKQKGERPGGLSSAQQVGVALPLREDDHHQRGTQADCLTWRALRICTSMPRVTSSLAVLLADETFFEARELVTQAEQRLPRLIALGGQVRRVRSFFDLGEERLSTPSGAEQLDQHGLLLVRLLHEVT